MGTGTSDDGRDHRLELLADVTRAFVEETHDLDRLFAVVARRISEAMGDTCFLLLLNEERDRLATVGVHDPDPTALELARTVASEPYLLAEHPTSRRAIETGEPIVAPRFDPSKIDTTPQFAALFKGLDAGGILFVPLRGRDRGIGLLILLRQRTRPIYNGDDVKLIRLLADHAALVLQNAHALAAERRAVAQVREFFDATPVAMFAFDLETNAILAANHAAQTLYGYTVDEMLALRIDDLRVAAENVSLTEQVRAATDSVMTGRAQHRRKDGSTFEVEGTSHVGLIGGRRARYAVVVDVSDRLEAESARRRAETRFARLFESGLVGIVVIDRQGVVREINGAATEMLGHTRESLGGRSWGTVIAPEWRSQHEISVRNLIEHGVDRPRELEYMHADGRRVSVITGAAVLPDENCAIRLVIDVEGQRWAPGAFEQLRETLTSEARFRAFVETAPDATVIVDTAGRMVLVNRRAEQLFGYAREELFGKRIELLVPERLRERHVDHVAGFMAAPKHRELESRELRGRRKDGSEFPIDLALSPIPTAQGLFVAGAVRDVSERRRIELALEDANQHLEAFSYSVAHDLRAPLRAVSGFASMLRESDIPLGDEGAQWLADIQRNATRMNELIDALLGLAKVSRAPLHSARVDLAALARTIIGQLAAAEPARTYVATIPDELIVHVDPRLAVVMLENLLSNAWKFTGRRERAEIELGEHVIAGERVIYVRDNGAGFDPEFATRLFTPFQRLHAASQFPGTGIGLSTVQRIVHRHGGRIWADSAKEQGATFSFTLPGDVS